MSSRQRSSRGPRPLLIIFAALLFGGGIYLGTRLAEPPPRPRIPPPEEEVIHEANLDLSQRPGRVPGQEPTEQAPGTPGQAPGTTGPAPGPDGPAERQPGPSQGPPRIAIVIDDLGRSVHSIDLLLSLGEPITFAVLPFESETPGVVRRLRESGAEYLLHLPMEARGKANPGEGALFLAMSRSELQRATESALGAVPGAAGVNNHMGSALAADPEAMQTVLEELKHQGLFYLDSRTAADTQGYTIARRLGLPTAERQVFLDNERDTGAIIKQLQVLFAMARSRGGAIAIAHPYAETIAALKAELPRAKASGIEIVHVSSLLDRRGPSAKN